MTLRTSALFSAIALITIMVLFSGPVVSGAGSNEFLNVRYDLDGGHDHRDATAPRTMSVSTPPPATTGSWEGAASLSLAMVLASTFMMAALILAVVSFIWRRSIGGFPSENRFLDILAGRFAMAGLVVMVAAFGLLFMTHEVDAGSVNTGVSWTAQGPAPLLNGQTEGISGPAPAGPNACAGAIHAVVTHPTNADIIYVGTINGGVWKTTNGTSASPTWIPLTDHFDSLSTSALDMDPSNPNKLVAGFGRFSAGARDGGPMLGMLLTTNGGSTWTLIGEDDIAGLSFASVAVRGNIIIGAANERYSGAATTGIWRSTNNGSDFTLISGNGAPGNALPWGPSLYLEGDPGDPDILYTAVLGANRGLFRSDNGGETWTDISNGGAGIVPSDIMDNSTNNVEFAVHNHGGNNVVYVGIMNNGRLAGFFWSSNKGANWTQMDLPFTPEYTRTVSNASNTTPIQITTTSDHGLNTNMYVSISGVIGNTAANGEWMITRISGTTFSLNGSSGNGAYAGGGTVVKYHPLQPRLKPGGQGSIHFSVVADPTDSNLVYVGGDRQDGPFPNSIGAVNYSGRLFRGDRSEPFTGGFNSTQWEPLTHSGTSNNSSPHADSRDMEFDANGNIIQVDDAGIYRRTSPQVSTGDWYSLNSNLQVTEFYRVDYDSRLNLIIGGAQDVGTPLQLTPNSTSDWSDAPNPLMDSGYMQADGGCTRIDDSSIDWVYRYFSIQRLGYFTRQKVDAGDGTIDSTVYIGLNVGGGQTLGQVDTMAFIQPYELNVVDPSHMIIHTTRIWESSDRGDNLTNADTRASTIASVAYGGYKGITPHMDVLYYGAGARLYLRSAGDGIGNAGTELTAYPGGTVVDIILDPADWQTAYILDSSARVYRVTDAGDPGESWTNITGILDDLVGEARTITYVVGSTRDYIAVGGNAGVFVCYEDAPGGWFEIGDNLPNAPVRELIYDARDDILLAGTWGRGAWTISGLDAYMTGIDITIDADDVGGNGMNNGIPDEFKLKLNATGDELEIYVSNSLFLNVPLDAVGSITINGSSDDDTLIVDIGNGMIATGSWILFDGEKHGNNSGSGDTLKIQGDPGVPILRETYIPGPLRGDGPADGMMILDPDGNMGPGANYKTNFDNYNGDEVIISFKNLSPIHTSSPATQFDIFLTHGPDTAMIENGPSIDGYTSNEVNDGGIGAYESVAFSNKTNVSVNGLDGADLITVNTTSMANGLSTLSLYGSEITGGVIESDDGAADQFTIRNVGTGITLRAYGQNGNDTFTIGSAANSLGGIQSLIFIEGQAHGSGTTSLTIGGLTNTLDSGDTLTLNDQGDAGDRTYTVTATSVSRSGASTIHYGTIETLNINTSAGGSDTTVTTTANGVNTVITAGVGSDGIELTTTGADSNVTIICGGGNDSVVIRGTGPDGGDANSLGSFLVVHGSGGDDTMTVHGTGQDSALELNGDGNDDHITVLGAHAATTLVVNGGNGNDTLTVDHTSGTPIPTGGITYDGGPQSGDPGDSLVFIGGSFTTVTYTFTTTDSEGHAGTVDLDGAVVTFRGLEPILNHGTVASVIFFLPDDPLNGDEAVLEDYGTASDGLNMLRSASNTFEDTVFTSPSLGLTVHCGDGDDHLHIHALDSLWTASVTVNGDAGNDWLQIHQTTGPALFALNGGSGNDYLVLRDSGFTMDGIHAPVSLDGGSGYDIALLLDSLSPTPDALITVTSGTVTGLSGDTISYQLLEYLFIDAPDSSPCRADILSTSIGTATTLNTGSDGDDIWVGSAGSLDAILGPLTIDDTQGGGHGDVLTYDDSSDPDSVTYSLSSDGSLTRTGGTAIPPITVTGIVEAVRLLAGTGPNTVEVDPSLDTAFFIDGEAPSTPLPADVLSIDLDGVTDVDFELIPSKIGMVGTLDFGDGHQPISFIRMETFDFLNGIIDLVIREDLSHDGFLTPPLPEGSGFADDGTEDTILVGLDGTGVYFAVGVNGIHQIALTFGDGIANGIAFVKVIGSGDDDTLVVDWSGGPPLPPEGILYDGGDEVSGDSMTLRNGTWNGTVGTIIHTFQGPHDGTVEVDGRIVTYTGLEPILDELIATHRIFTFGPSDDDITITDHPTPGLSTISSLSSSETVDFASPTPTGTLTVNCGDGDDVVTLGADDPGMVPGFDPSMTAALTINGEDGWNEINVLGPVGTPPPPPPPSLASIAFNLQLANLHQPMYSPAISGTCLIVNVWYPGLIQNGLDVAHATDGCLITVYPATYPENLTSWKPDLRLRSSGGNEVTTIVADSGIILDLAPGTRGFTLGGAHGEGFALRSTGAVTRGVSGIDLVDPTITHNHFRGPGMDNGIHLTGVTASDHSSDSLIRKNIFDDCGTAIAVFTGMGVTDLTITLNCMFNSLDRGILLGKDGDGEMNRVVITENTISRTGLGLGTGVGLHIMPGQGILSDFFVVRLNNFLHNDMGLLNETTLPVLAVRNYWGSSSGPSAGENHNGTPNPLTGFGTGDPIHDYVLADPWLTIIHHPSPCDLPIRLTPGWTMVSITVGLDDLNGAYTASVFAAEMNSHARENPLINVDILRYIVRYDALTGVFEEFVVSSGVGYDFPIEYGRAYYVFSIAPIPVEFHIVGDCPVYESFDLVECWNLIPWMSMQTMNVGDFAAIIDHHAGWFAVQAIVKYDESYSLGENRYITWYPGLDDDLFEMTPGQAYWVFSAVGLTEVAYP